MAELARIHTFTNEKPSRVQSSYILAVSLICMGTVVQSEIVDMF